MKHRNFRIAWSVAWGVVAVLLCALWVRSYWCEDSISRFKSMRNAGVVHLRSYEGWLLLDRGLYSGDDDGWRYRADEILASDPFAPNFEWTFVDERTRISAPHWCLASLVGAFAVVPWIRWSNRFSLRTLLIATTLIAVLLGIIVWMSR
jgi:hypothetical protein